MFRAHDVPADGDCLFHSLKVLLNLQISVAQLSAQVVDCMETREFLETDERFNIINEHLLRDAGWTNERILGPQGFVDSDGDQLDQVMSYVCSTQQILTIYTASVLHYCGSDRV